MNLGSCVTLIRAYAKVPRRHKLVSLEQYSWNCKQLPAFQCGSKQSIPFDVYPNHAYKSKCLAHTLPPSAYSNCQALHISLLPATGSSYCVCHKACIKHFHLNPALTLLLLITFSFHYFPHLHCYTVVPHVSCGTDMWKQHIHCNILWLQASQLEHILSVSHSK